MKLIVKSFSGAAFEIEIDENKSLSQLKQQISKKEKVDVNAQTIIFQGKQLTDDSKKLKSLGITENGTILHLNIRQRPNGPNCCVM